MKIVEGYSYLYQRGGKYLVRMQVPEKLRDRVGKGELRKSLGGDLAQAIRGHHGVVAAFHGIIDAAGAPASDVVLRPNQPATTRSQIDQVVYDHFARMKEQSRHIALAPDHPNPRSRQGRMRGLEEHIDLMLDSLDVDDFALVGSHADHLMAEQGWDFAPSGEEYRYLCRRILRARLAAFRDELRRLQGDFSPPTTTDPDFGPRRAKVPDDARTLRELIDAFVKHREGTWAPSTKKNYAIITRVLEEICGEETPLNEIDGDFCLRVLDTVKRLPSNYQKKALTRGKPIREVIDIAAAENMPIVQPATIKMHLDKLGAFIRFGRDKGWIVGNPMALVEVYDPVHPSEKRDPFTIEQLNKIFAMEPWASRNQRPGGRPSRYWGPLIALFSGARLGEICGTRLDEIIQHNGISLIDIRHRADRTVKTGQSRRVPVHAALIELGFLDFVGEQRDIGETMLFPEEKRNSNGLWGDALTDWFSRAIKDLNLVGRKLTMHAFRHTFEDALREADLHDTAIASALTGRWSPGQNKNYGTRGHSTQKLSAAMSKIAFPGLVLAGLTPVSADARGPTLTTDELHD